ncbi:methionine--tRNA ligase [Candidatus Wolfebacteria bacterium]|nr:methionine--tRNA ligase [Candidatus Wolfebacteria bacterium]
MNKFYITTPIYYASGRPHIGHAFATVYADVIARYREISGEEVFFSVGVDEHGAKIAQLAERENKKPQDFVDEMFLAYKKAWQVLNVKYGDFIRTTDQRHKKGVNFFLEKLQKNGDIFKGEYEGFYCVGCEKFIFEKDLIGGFCPDHRRKPEKIKETNYFLNLKKYLPKIRELIESDELKIVPASRKNEALAFIGEEPESFSLSRERVKWGIPYPGDESQTIYVWVEALMNYLTVLDYPDGERYKNFWPPDLQIIGAEINKFHTIFWPALLLAVGERLPKEIFIHGLFTINGAKMSKAAGNVIDPLVLAEKFGGDAVRYLLLSQFPAGEHGDVAESRFVEKYNSDLANGLGNLFERILALAVKYKENFGDLRVRGIKQEDKIDRFIAELCRSNENNYRQKMDGYQLYEALGVVFFLAKKFDQYINQKEPWKLFGKNDREKLEECLDSLIFGAEKIISWLTPFMPIKMAAAVRAFKEINPEKLNLFPRF